MSEVVGEAVVVVRQDESKLDLAGAGERSGKGFAGAFGGIMSKLPAIAGVGAVAAVVSKVFVSGLNLDAGAKKIQAQLGLTEEQSATAGRVAGELYADNFGDSVGDTQQAVASVISGIKGLRDASEKDINAASTAALEYAGVFDTEIPDAVNAASQVINSGLAGNAVDAFDLLTAASQRVPQALRQDLFDAATEYSKSFDQIGLSGKQAFGVLASASDQGVFGLDKAGDAVKEFTIRATDGSDATQSAYKSLGLDAGRMSNLIIKGGEGAGVATQEVVKQLLKIKDPTKQASTALALFGTPLEDLGTKNIPQFLQSLQGTGDALGKVSGATDKAANTMNDTPLVQIQAKFRSLQAAVTEVGLKALPYIIDGFGVVSRVVSDVSAVVGSTLAPVISQVGAVFTTEVLPVLQQFGQYVVSTVLPVVMQLGQTFITSILPVLRQVAGFIIGQVIPAMVSIYATIAKNLKPVLDTLVQVFVNQILPALQKLAKQVQTELLPALEPLIIKALAVARVFYVVASAILGRVLPPLLKLAAFILVKVIPVVVSIITFLLRFVGGLISLGAAIGRAIGHLGAFAGALAGKVKDAVSAVVSAVTGLPGKIIALGGRMLTAGKSIIGKFIDGLKGAGGVVSGIAGNIWDVLKGLLNGAIDRINNALEFSISIGFGKHISINPPDIAHLQAGTDFAAAGFYNVGEVGPERVYLPEGARVLTAAQTRQAQAQEQGPAAGVLTAAQIMALRPIEVHNHYPLPEKPSTATQRLSNLPFLLGA